jgi:transcriptional regulator with XRE-family HTH domain
LTFASLLRSARREAELSQAELAEAAHISLWAIGAYERGIRTKPHPETVALLANALGLTGSARTAFEDAARGRSRGNASRDRYPRSLTVANTAFVGRSADVANITASLGEHRVVTLTGPGGMGKTRLAAHVAAQFVEQRDAVLFVELAALTEGTQAVHSIASLLGIPPSRKGDALGRVIDDLRSRDALLVLDNCEHIIESIATMAAALSRECPRLTILATSRERVRIGGEAVYVVPPLGADAAVELFASRAAAVDGAFRLDETTAPLVAEVCRRLTAFPSQSSWPCRMSRRSVCAASRKDSTMYSTAS